MPRKGWKHTPDSKLKISMSKKGICRSDLTKSKISQSMKGKLKKPFTDEHKEKLSIAHLGQKPWNIGIITPNNVREKISKANSGKPKPRLTDEHKRKIGEAAKRRKRFPVSLETKRKTRRSIIKYIKENRGGFFRNIGKNETSLLDLQESRDGCTIIRNHEIELLGYFADGYCKETNTVYEVYEKFHDSQSQKDLERETEICNHLSCDFIIIHDRTH